MLSSSWLGHPYKGRGVKGAGAWVCGQLASHTGAAGHLWVAGSWIYNHNTMGSVFTVQSRDLVTPGEGPGL